MSLTVRAATNMEAISQWDSINSDGIDLAARATIIATVEDKSIWYDGFLYYRCRKCPQADSRRACRRIKQQSQLRRRTPEFNPITEANDGSQIANCFGYIWASFWVIPQLLKGISFSDA